METVSREHPRDLEIEHALRSELADAFGNSDGVFQDMKVRTIFKGVTYELLSDPDFMRVASQAIPVLDALHDEFEAAKAEKQGNDQRRFTDFS
ncbi:MAG TPA: hypothetical protein VIH89_05030 [Candidatus Sulfotelmatobacter sp.]|jgi:hypothetical protein